MDWVTYILFYLGGKPVMLIDLLSAVFGLTTVFLAGRASKYNFWVGYVYTVLLALMFLNKNLYANLILQPISLVINVMGHYRWTHPREEEKTKKGELKVTMLPWSLRVLTVLVVLVLAALWGWLMSKTDNPLPYLDCCVTALILAAQFLSSQKKFECWIAWLFVNIANLTLYISAGLVFMPIVSALYLINAVISLVNWYKLYKKE